MTYLRAITFDFWSTLVDGAITPQRTAERLARLHRALVGAGLAHSPKELRAAFTRALDRVAGDAQESLRDVGPPGRWAALAAELGIPDGLIPYEVVEHAYEDITLDPLPALMPYVEEAVRAVKHAGYRMGVICNTGMAGGRVLREVLARYALLDMFDVSVWSNEFGWSKPDPRIFAHALDALGQVPPERALHVGDLEELDVEGARRAGVHSALYAPGPPDGHVTTDAELIVRDWRSFAAQLSAFEVDVARALVARPRGLRGTSPRAT
jgi:putative hydrolase of the HAD superfamily